MSENSPQISHTPSLESPFSKYLREYRLLNSLLISLFAVVCLFTLLWNIVVWVAPSGMEVLTFPMLAQTIPLLKKQEQRVRLCSGRSKQSLRKNFTFQAQAISDIVAPVVEIETKDLSPAMALPQWVMSAMFE